MEAGGGMGPGPSWCMWLLGSGEGVLAVTVGGMLVGAETTIGPVVPLEVPADEGGPILMPGPLGGGPIPGWWCPDGGGPMGDPIPAW